MSRRIRSVTLLAFLPVTDAIQSHLTATTFAFICKGPDNGINRDYEVSADATDLKKKSGLQSPLQVPETQSASEMSCETRNHSEKIPVTQASALRVAADTPAIAAR